MPRPSTPPSVPGPSKAVASPPTPEVTRRIEESRLRAKSLRAQHEAAQRHAGVSSLNRTSSGIVATNDISFPRTRKRVYDEIASVPVRNTPATSRDGRANGALPDNPTTTGEQKGDEGAIRPARKFTKFVDYDFDKITDTKGGFLTADDDPFNKAMSGAASANAKAGPPQDPTEQKPQGMSAQEWERLQLLRKLRKQKAGPFQPGLSVLTDDKERKKCRECNSLEIDYVWDEVFNCRICNQCKEKLPEKYSLLTKTEAREDYLLTDPELRDEDLLPQLSRPNPHKSHWHDMMLFLRYQVEEYAFSDKKWGSAEALDSEFERRETEKKQRKEKKFKEKLQDLKKRTLAESHRRQGTKAGKAKFGETIGKGGKHEHEWGRVIENEEGATLKTCTTCGMEVEELEF
ncbi:XPA protein C-terminus-domain-containing protein [Pseudomassariella vexata]|uniref:DNA repair protein RAD14 n=1 Tax=Pseudomassariella vexata TaxID=1141098 RepID=A0A1Y2DC57_9PEZI|nr:XPA protein C-terminus-domain-containing protein [Pseudomassariella vexata]ORY56850.1 XPA protein C-terminus-domain-containing protein [Pseudomassariella vexata]